MQMDIIDESSKSQGEGGKLLVVMLVGAPGSGKSTFCEHAMRSSARPWLRICQDSIANGKAGTKAQCLNRAASALKDGVSVFIDRCNLDREQRSEFIKLCGPQIDVHAVVLDLPAQICISRSVKRSGHEGNLQGGKAAAVVNKMLQKKELPKISERFNRITFCQNESQVQAAIDMYNALGPLDNLPHGCFGQKKADGKVQLGIMKFLKKVEGPVYPSCTENNIEGSVSPQIVDLNDASLKEPGLSSSVSGIIMESEEGKDQAVGFVGSLGSHDSLDDASTLAFPSISTSDFHFNLEKAADIIVEKVSEFINKLGNARLVFVDLSHQSKILSLVKSRSIKKGIDSSKFLIHVGDITRLYSGGGLHCKVIANAANWRLKPGGGGVNAAIFNAAGPTLESATKERANSLLPGNAVVVPLPSTSPLFTGEGVTHVIHVLGPNMNPQRPNCLNNDYHKGCKILREAYTSLFEGFAAIIRNQSEQPGGICIGLQSKSLDLDDHSEGSTPRKDFQASNQKLKRDRTHESDSSKKCEGSHYKYGANSSDFRAVKDNKDDRSNGSMSKCWASWSLALYQIVMHPEKHRHGLLEILEEVVVLNDIYPKAKRHILVLARKGGLDCLANVQRDHIQLLRTMHAVGLKWAEKFLLEDALLVFRLGYHSVPSMRQLHLHVISQDFDSKHLKNKKHWNSFNTAFFRDSLDVIDEVANNGKVTLEDDEKLLSIELRCHRCRSAHPNLPLLKSHLIKCRAPFPQNLVQNGHLVHGPDAVGGGS